MILANKQDAPNAVDDIKMRKVLQLDRLKAMNPDLTFYVKGTTGRTGQGIGEAF